MFYLYRKKIHNNKITIQKNKNSQNSFLERSLVWVVAKKIFLNVDRAIFLLSSLKYLIFLSCPTPPTIEIELDLSTFMIYKYVHKISYFFLSLSQRLTLNSHFSCDGNKEICAHNTRNSIQKISCCYRALSFLDIIAVCY